MMDSTQSTDGTEWDESVMSYGGLEIPLLNWCRDCWDEIAPPDERLPDKCPDCGSRDVMKL